MVLSQPSRSSAWSRDMASRTPKPPDISWRFRSFLATVSGEPTSRRPLRGGPGTPSFGPPNAAARAVVTWPRFVPVGERTAGPAFRRKEAPMEPDDTVVVTTNVLVPMRDGVRLATDIHRPVGMEGRCR